MVTNQFDVYAEFLLECKKVMGSVDFQRFDHDSDYRTAICERVIAKADDRLFDIAQLVNQNMDEEESKNH